MRQGAIARKTIHADGSIGALDLSVSRLDHRGNNTGILRQPRTEALPRGFSWMQRAPQYSQLVRRDAQIVDPLRRELVWITIRQRMVGECPHPSKGLRSPRTRSGFSRIFQCRRCRLTSLIDAHGHFGLAFHLLGSTELLPSNQQHMNSFRMRQ